MVYTPSERFELPRSRKILKADAYASVLRMRVCARTDDFVLHHFSHKVAKTPPQLTQSWAQLGLVVPKRLSKLSVRRNLVKRLARESFRLRAAQLPAGMWVVRLSNNINQYTITPAQKKLWAEQLTQLWQAGIQFSNSYKAGKVTPRDPSAAQGSSES